MLKRTAFLTFVLGLTCWLVGCGGEFLTGGDLDTDPNRAVKVPIDNLFVGMQVNSYGVTTGPLSFVPVMWLQQMSGVSQHWSGYELYEMSGIEFNAPWFDVYGGAGLGDMRTIRKRAAEEGRRTIAGMTKLWEALTMNMAADLWGDIPYAEAADPSQFPTPKFDKQSEVAAALISLIDEAIADLGVGGFFDGSLDFTYGGDRTKWVAAAHSLKARILLNWAEVNPANYALALAEARQGIQSEADNWTAKHSDTSGEESMWYQFDTNRGRYFAVGGFIADLLTAHGDPRLQIYLDVDESGGHSGSPPGSNTADASFLNPATFGSKSWNSEILTWAETQFIIAECLFAGSDEAGALSTLNNVIQPGLEAKWGLADGALPRYAGLSGADLLEAIMLEKYKALFLNAQIWSDWKRTAFPILPSTALGRQLPRRLLYADSEITTNPNATLLGLYTRTENDPGNPSYPGRTVNP